MTGRVLRFKGRSIGADDSRVQAEGVLGVAPADRVNRAVDLRLEDPETLLGLCGVLRQRIETSPALVRDEATWFYRYLFGPKRAIGLFDEREYFIGELALLAGTACRILALRDEAQLWFDRADSNFRLTVNAVADWSRVSYQRLAIRLEERDFERLLEQLPCLIESFEKLDMQEEALKARFLEGAARLEKGDLDGAASVYEEIVTRATRLGNDRLLASACVNMVHVNGMAGRSDEALRYSREAIPILERQGNKVELGKLRVAVGFALRSNGDLSEAVTHYRQAQEQFADLSMFADVAALHLTIADLLLDLHQEALALREVLTALPILDKYKLLPEGAAALALLRESLRQQKVDHQALRDLHGFFEEPVS